MSEGPLVTVDWLAAHASDPRVLVVDVRWYLSGKRGVDAYDAGHIPGASFVDLDAELAGDPARGPGRHPLPALQTFAALLSRLGVTEGSIVVAYDDAGGAIAARMWWLLRYFGHRDGRVLDGGIGAWIAAGHVLETDAPRVTSTPPLVLRPGGAPVVDKADVARLVALGLPAAVVLDARARERYEGRSEPIDARAGHVPGARNAPFVENLVAPGGAFLPREALAARYRALGALDAKSVACYCGSGVTACHDLLALAILGRDDVALYEGSWSDWARDAALPIETG
ncbi:sulfurtransferase [Polyangium mundeleinium]|uniref:Sulfurtransferase n=1 Tax=Polyangium mundeleinium TaxID=2995306 RepID=A0ABT5ELT0_9BACT|nr:sulfurtransferase [Polyangium mundeleinium]MDC0741882.1 sulfurtransferase [Polyangium mundeleinium]